MSRENRCFEKSSWTLFLETPVKCTLDLCTHTHIQLTTTCKPATRPGNMRVKIGLIQSAHCAPTNPPKTIRQLWFCETTSGNFLGSFLSAWPPLTVTCTVLPWWDHVLWVTRNAPKSSSKRTGSTGSIIFSFKRALDKHTNSLSLPPTMYTYMHVYIVH